MHVGGRAPPSHAWVLSEREKKVSEIGEAVKPVGWEFGGAIPVLASSDNSVGDPLMPACRIRAPFPTPRRSHSSG